MLPRLSKVFSRSVKKHNSDYDLVCDWVEASLLFSRSFSRSDLLDILIEEQFYDDQDFCSEFLEDVWRRVRRRRKRQGTDYPFAVSQSRIRLTADSWENTPAHAFCVFLSLAPFFPGYHDEFKAAGYGIQGSLFERMTEASVRARFPDWTVMRPGWGDDHHAKIVEVVRAIADAIQESARPEKTILEYAGAAANEAGVDLVWHLQLDDRHGFTTYLAQCASGRRSEGKLTTPNLDVWARMIDFNHKPIRSFALPKELDEGELRTTTHRVGGLVLDRSRLLSTAMLNAEWLSDELKAEIRDWMRPRVEWLRRQE